MRTINPYLMFGGKCEEAFLFYKSVFKGEFAHLGRFAEMPPSPEQPPIPEVMKQKIMHVSLPINDQCVLMGCDSPELMGKEVAHSNCSLSINNDDRSEAKRMFDALSVRGKVSMPMQDTFWGSYYGQVKDQFGIDWLVNCDEIPASNDTQP